LILVSYRNLIQLQASSAKVWAMADENTPDAKNHQTFDCNQCNSGAKSQKLGNLANM
jgi:hypothetical protein